MSAITLDRIPPYSIVELELFSNGEAPDGYERAVFTGITGEGAARQANFVSLNEDGSSYGWAAYRSGTANRPASRWAWGSSDDRVSLVSVVASVQVAA